MDILFLLQALFKKKWVIILCTLAGFLGGLTFVLLKKDYYQSAAQYSTGFTMKQQVKLKDDGGFNFLEVDQRFKNVIETFKSPVVIGMLSYELMLHDLIEKRPFRVLTDNEKKKIKLNDVQLDSIRRLLQTKLARQELLIAYESTDAKAFELIKVYKYDNESILRQLLVDRIQGTDYLNILFKSENPELSAFVVNTIGKKFYNFFTKINSERTGESITKLDSITLAKKNEYDLAVDALQRFREKVGSPDVGDRAKGAMEMLQALTEQQNNNEAKLNDLKGQLNSVKTQLKDPDLAGTATNSNAEITSLLQKNRELARQLANKGGTDVNLQNQIDANIKRMQQLEPNVRGNSKSDIAKKRDELTRKKTDLEYDIASLQSTIGSVQQKINLYGGMSNQGGGDEVTVQRLQNEVDRLNTEYQSLVARSQSAQDVNVAPDINFKQTLIGQPAIKPEPGKRKVIIILSTMASFIVSALSILILDFLDNSLRTPTIFQRNVKLPLLASLNKLNLENRPLTTILNTNKNNAAPVSKSEEVFIENIRKLRFELESRNKKIVLFTSTKAQQGKTTIIQALSSSLSLTNKKVLLIDTNFANNTLTEIYNAKPVLDTYMVSNNKQLLDQFWNITTKTNIPHTDMVGCHKGQFTPNEILPKNHLLTQLDVLKNEYDYIFLEGADLNTHADSKELSLFAEGIVVVFSANATIGQLDKESIQFIKQNENKLLGAVLNQVDMENLEL